MFEETWLNSRDMFAEPDAFIRTASYDLPVSQWTAVPLDNDLLNHILLLFWTWDMLGNRIIDRTMFEEDMRTLDPSANHDGELVFCSPLLINALLALSCVSKSWYFRVALTDDRSFTQRTAPPTLNQATIPQEEQLLPRKRFAFFRLSKAATR